MSTARANQENDARAPRPEAGRGWLSELFCSVQGEGPYVGERQLFVRTAGCSAMCTWCDTVYSKVQTPRFVIHDDDKRALPNPVSLDRVFEEVVACARRNAPVATVSVTGGEPLEQPEFVAALAARLREAGLRVYLETAGIHPNELRAVIDHVDVIAMDIKLPSAIGREAWDDHAAFLDVAAAAVRADLFVKVVMDARARVDEVETASRLIAARDRGVELILQPESETLLSPRTPRERADALLDTIGAAQATALRFLDNVRVMPQCHKILRIR